MKAGAIAFGLLASGAAMLAWGPTISATTAVPVTRHPNPINAPAEGIPRRGRVFLTDAQQRQAIASGTIDRPVKSLLSVQAPLHYGDYLWNDRGISRGPTWIRVDLGSQLISIFRAGHEIGTAVIVYGGDNKQTPIGTLHILGKAREHRSSVYYAEMPYTLRLTNDGVSIHGSDVRWGAATHGCIGVPLAFAGRLFDAAKVGDEVVIIPPAKAARARTS
jgi:L,D-transpeptidase catalytic domain